MNIVDLLDESGVEYRLPGQHQRATRGWVNIDCPKCSPDSGKFMYGIHIQSLTANCWSCGRDSRGVKATLSTLGIDGQRTATLLRSRAKYGQYGTLPEKDRRRATKCRLPEGLAHFRRSHLRYIKQRGFDPDVLSRIWGVKGIGLTMHYRWRLFIPVIAEGEIVTWTTRSVIKAETKRYLNARPEDEVVPIKECLYGEQYARNSIVVLEGPTDVWAVGPGSVGTFGLTLTDTQIAKIAKYPRRIICFDNSPEAQRAATLLCHELKSFPGETINVRLETGSDPAECDRKELKLLRKQFIE